MRKQEIIEELYILSESVSLETALFQERVAAKVGLTVNDMRALSIIMKHDGINATTLSKKLGVTNGAITGILERLTKKKLIRKQLSKDDRRKMIVVANYQQIATNATDYNKIGAAYSELLQSYNVEELGTILDYSQRLLTLTHQQAAMVGSESVNSVDKKNQR